MTEVKQEKSTMTEVKLCMTEVKLSCGSYDRSETKGYDRNETYSQNYDRIEMISKNYDRTETKL